MAVFLIFLCVSDMHGHFFLKDIKKHAPFTCKQDRDLCK